MSKAALSLLVGSAFAAESPVRSELDRDALWRRDSIAGVDLGESLPSAALAALRWHRNCHLTQAQGLVIEDQWWAPVYFARHDRERAITLLKDLLRPELGDVLREAAAESPAPAQTLSP